MKNLNTSLINQTLRNEFARIGEQREESDPMVLAKFFNPSGAGTWYAISFDPQINCCFGYVTDFGFDELGYFSTDELEDLRVPPFGLKIEQDLYFTTCHLSEIIKKSSQ